MSNYIAPVVLIIVFAAGLIKKVNCYDAFVCGAKQSLSLCADIFPFLAAMLTAIALMRSGGIDKFLGDALAPVFNLLGVPAELSELIILRPFTGSGSIAILNDIYAQYGVDSYVGRCASVIMGVSETVFYIAGVYFAKTEIRKLGCAIPVALVCSFIGCILACLFCRIM